LGALLLALFYSRARRGIGIYRAAAYLPTVIPDAAYALTWTWIFNPLYGPLNALLLTLGLPAPNWLTDSAWTLHALILMSLFQIGEGFVILLVGLRHIPREVYDAARVDGANRWQTFSAITFPLLTPWLVLLTVRDLVITFQNTFTPAYLMTRGGPYYATFFLPQLAYELAFDGLRFGQAAAVMVLIFIYTLFLVLVVYFLFEGWGFDEE
jgi:multiple sugar transport system permease protein